MDRNRTLFLEIWFLLQLFFKKCFILHINTYIDKAKQDESNEIIFRHCGGLEVLLLLGYIFTKSRNPHLLYEYATFRFVRLYF